jgi:hypothetical protein
MSRPSLMKIKDQEGHEGRVKGLHGFYRTRPGSSLQDCLASKSCAVWGAGAHTFAPAYVSQEGIICPSHGRCASWHPHRYTSLHLHSALHSCAHMHTCRHSAMSICTQRPPLFGNSGVHTQRLILWVIQPMPWKMGPGHRGPCDEFHLQIPVRFAP